MRTPRANRLASTQQAGFTLLELLVVVVVLGLLIVGLSQGVRAGLALWNAQSRRTDETSELDAAARVLRSLLSGITASPTAGFNPGAPAATDRDRIDSKGRSPRAGLLGLAFPRSAVGLASAVGRASDSRTDPPPHRPGQGRPAPLSGFDCRPSVLNVTAIRVMTL